MKYLVFIIIFNLCLFGNALAQSVDCKNAVSTPDIIECQSITLEAAEEKLSKYFNATLEHYSSDERFLDNIKQAQEKWDKYTTAHCDSIWQKLQGGTLRNIIWMSCKIEKTKERTFEIWRFFLKIEGGGTPLLPQPEV